MKHVEERPYTDLGAAARKLVELATSIESVQDGRIHIEKINGAFLYKHKGSGPEYAPSSRGGSNYTRAAPMCGC